MLGMEVGNIKKEEEVSRVIDKRLSESYHSDADGKLKFLLLGMSGAGKSTVLKQLMDIYGHDFFDEDARIEMVPIIHKQTILAMKQLIEHAEELGCDIRRNHEKESMKAVGSDVLINETIGSCIQLLWNDEGILEAYDQRFKFNLIDSAKYYFDNIRRIMNFTYIPTHEDLVKLYIPTSISKEVMRITAADVGTELPIEVIDVGGDFTKREKLVHYFDDVHCIIFVVDLSSFCEMSKSDPSKNCIIEALQSFQKISKSRWFHHRTITSLFFNKSDLFEYKIKHYSPREFSHDFPDVKCTCEHGYWTDKMPCTCGAQDEAIEFFVRMFRRHSESNGRNSDQLITTATKKDSVKKSFEIVKSRTNEKFPSTKGLFSWI
eukprot:TRINITY_DN9150_c0_g1_i1.p1 TRINITY_DN9150_c0_g1~~TRINITY_DN9150_c0_g1_i1.p1  ORF type:complete len:376 (-),score=93.47 TRINITY_DN9150_c0_g1_i1:393-1520(-)